MGEIRAGAKDKGSDQGRGQIIERQEKGKGRGRSWAGEYKGLVRGETRRKDKKIRENKKKRGRVGGSMW